MPRILFLLLAVFWVEVASAAVWPPSLSSRDALGVKIEPVALSDYARVLYVAPGVTGADGSREHPYADVRIALEHTSDSTQTHRTIILVAKGHYVGANIKMLPYVDLFGSYDPSTWERRGGNVPDTILDANYTGPVVLGADHARIDGFVITRGRHDGHGGGIACAGTSPEISNNWIIDNATQEFPGFRHDLPYQRGYDGGGVSVHTGSTAIVRNNLIANNSTEMGNGGGIAVWNFSKPVISGNIICNNRSGLGEREKKIASRSSAGGGIAINFYCNAKIDNNIVTTNQAFGNSDAGAIYLEHEGSATVEGNLLVGNHAEDDGGAIYCMKTSVLTLIGNVIAGNKNYGDTSGGIRISVEGRMKGHYNLIMQNSTGLCITESWTDFTHNAVIENFGLKAGISYNNFLDHMMVPNLSQNVLAANKGEPFLMQAEHVTGEPRMVDNLIRGDSARLDDLFADDGFEGDYSDCAFDAKSWTTQIKLNTAPSAGEDLAGRVIACGDAYGVIAAVHDSQVNIWGNLALEPGHFKVLRSGALAVNSVAASLLQ